MVTPELITRWTIVACRNKAEVMGAMSPSLSLAGPADPRHQEDLVHLVFSPPPTPPHNGRSSTKLRKKVCSLYGVTKHYDMMLQASLLVFWRLLTLAIFINGVRRMKTSLKFLRPGSPVRYSRIDGHWWRVRVDRTVRAFRHAVTMLQRVVQKSWIEYMCWVTYITDGICVRTSGGCRSTSNPFAVKRCLRYKILRKNPASKCTKIHARISHFYSDRTELRVSICEVWSIRLVRFSGL